MRRVPFALALIMLPAAAGAADAPPGVTAATEAFISAISGTDPAPFAALFTPHAAITDTLGKFHWAGKDAPSAYFADLQTDVKAAGWVGLQLAHHGAPTIMANGHFAYAALPLYVNYTVKGAKKQDEGIFVLSLTEKGQDWKISSAAWAYTSAPPP